jgi:DNA repair exonuclease SbcCD ATPase subunit
MVEAGIGEAVRQLYGNWLDEFTTRLEAEFENQRQLQRAWASRVEQRLEQNTAGLADIARRAAESEALGQRLDALETRLLALESAAVSMATPPEAWLETVDQRVRLRVADLGVGAEHQEAMLVELRQELLHRMNDLHAADEQVSRHLAGRIEALSEALQQRMASMQALEDAHGQRLGSIEQRVAALEAAGSRAEVDRLRDQIRVLSQSQDALHAAITAQGEGLGTLMAERFAQLRAELDAALQSAAPDQKAAPEVALHVPRVQSAAAEPKAEMATEPAADTLPAAVVDQDLEAGLAQRLADEWYGRWQAEIQRLQNKVKTLTLVTAGGAVALLAALIILAS